MGRRGTRRPGLTFAQQMGLLVSRSGDQHSQSSARIIQSDWRASGITNGISDISVEKSFYFNAGSISAHERSEMKLNVTDTSLIQENPFLDDTDRSFAKTSTQLRKTASGRLLDPVDVISPEATTRKLDSTVSDAGSETELEQDADEAEGEEDDSPYLIESSDPVPAPDNASQAVANDVFATATERFADELEDSSDLSEMSDAETDVERGHAIDEQEDGYVSVDPAANGNKLPIRNSLKRSPSITASFAASKGSSANLDKNISTPPNSFSRSKKTRERRTWGKPIVGDTEDNPFLASSTIGKPKIQASATEAGSWLRTDNAKTRRSEGEKPTIEYLLYVVVLSCPVFRDLSGSCPNQPWSEDDVCQPVLYARSLSTSRHIASSARASRVLARAGTSTEDVVPTSTG